MAKALLIGLQSRQFETIQSFDLNPVTRKLESKGVEGASRLEAEFKRLATIWYVDSDRRHAPSEAVDRYWHELILDTQRYRKFCEVSFGRFIDHVPAEVGSDRKEERNAYRNTIEAYERVFGEKPPEDLWPVVGASCDDGDSDFNCYGQCSHND